MNTSDENHETLDSVLSKKYSIGLQRLNIETYPEGMNQVTHPSAIYFKEKWCGYHYWMAYTPYPFAMGKHENPCIAVSNDLLYWDVPEGLINPIATNLETECDELKDAHILYHEDLNRIEVWYLGRLSANMGGDGKQLLLFRKYSYDGVNWSSYEVMTPINYLSPSVIWDGKKYQCWAIGFEKYNTSGTVIYMESVDGHQWSIPEECFIDGKKKDISIWHGSVSLNNGKYELVYIEDGGNSQSVKYCDSIDGKSFGHPIDIVSNNKKTPWDHLYRPFLLDINDAKVCIYGVVTCNNEWCLSISEKNNLGEYHGITSIAESKMRHIDTKITDRTKSAYKIRHKLRIIYKAIAQF